MRKYKELCPFLNNYPFTIKNLLLCYTKFSKFPQQSPQSAAKNSCVKIDEKAFSLVLVNEDNHKKKITLKKKNVS